MDSNNINTRRLYFPHKIQYDGKSLKDCSQEELIEAICSAAQEIEDLQQLTERQQNLLNFVLEMWRVNDKKPECSRCSEASMRFMLNAINERGT
jgi:hypothetical protein